MTVPVDPTQIKAMVDQLAADRDAALAQVAALEAQVPPAPAAPEVRWLADNFPSKVKSGAYVPSGFVGDGRGRTEYRMRDGSSTRGPEIAKLPRQGQPGWGVTNPYYLMWMGGVKGAPVDDALAADFDLYGPALGHPVGGLFVGPGSRAVVKGVGIFGVQGELSGPPTEEPLLTLYGQEDWLIEDVLLDGRDSTGKAVASSPLMLSSSGSGVMHGLRSIYAAFGFSVAWWRMHGFVQAIDCEFGNSRRDWNLEQVEDGFEINAVRPVLGNTKDGWHMQISTHGLNARARINVFDPVNGQFVVKSYGPNTPTGNGMRYADDIKAYLRGKLATAQLVKVI